MSGDELALAPKTLDEAKSLSTTLAKASTLPEAYRGKEADVLMAIMAGREMGLAPIQSLRAFDVVKGRPTLKAEAMVALVRARRDVCAFFQCVHSDATKATWTTQRVGDPSPTSITWTMEQSRVAGLTSSDMYKKYPDIMLRWRAASMLVKLAFSDVVLGLYTAEELTDGQVVDSTATVTPASAGAAAVEEVKQRVRAKRLLVVEEPPAAPALEAGEAQDVVGWGRHQARPLATLSDDEIAWYVSEEGEAKTRKATPESAERLLSAYRAEVVRRLSAAGQGEEVAS
jgi:hypothetical protein